MLLKNCFYLTKNYDLITAFHSKFCLDAADPGNLFMGPWIQLLKCPENIIQINFWIQ